MSTVGADDRRFYKQLQIDYLWNGEERTKRVAEESVLTISDQGR